MYQKITPAFINACSEIQEKASVPIKFNFLSGTDGLSERALKPVLEKKLNDVTFFRKVGYSVYSEIIAGSDLQLTPFPFGNTNSFVDAMLVGVPTICLDGEQLHSRNDVAFAEKVGLPKFCQATSVDDYIQAAVRLLKTTRSEIRSQMPLKPRILISCYLRRYRTRGKT